MSPTFSLDPRMKNLITQLTKCVLGWADSYIITKYKETPSTHSWAIHSPKLQMRVYVHTESQTLCSVNLLCRKTDVKMLGFV